MGNFGSSISTFFWNLFNRPRFVDIIDIIVVAYIIYKLLMLTHGTRALQVLKGFLLLVVASWLSSLLALTTLHWLLMLILNNGAIVLMILFQPEFRQALERIGRGARIDRNQRTQTQEEKLVNNIAQSLLNLSRRRIGALIVFEKQTGLKDFIDTGVMVDGLLSGELLVNIFEPNTPLHDGAVIVRGDRIAAAACVLTLSEDTNLSKDLGTRHRAGIGVSEGTDATVIIVSEETGIISMARGGKLTRHLDSDSLKEILSGIFKQNNSTSFAALWQSAKSKIASIRKKEDEQ
ncbi:MAG: diadenylate cyclase CdaA [Eubacteriales bacterium]|nr:diadenylate cyclase CdaA [Eubacteriales bacterium]